MKNKIPIPLHTRTPIHPSSCCLVLFIVLYSFLVSIKQAKSYIARALHELNVWRDHRALNTLRWHHVKQKENEMNAHTHRRTYIVHRTPISAQWICIQESLFTIVAQGQRRQLFDGVRMVCGTWAYDTNTFTAHRKERNERKKKRN